MRALPASVRRVAVLDRTKEPGRAGRAALPRRLQRARRGARGGRARVDAGGDRRALRAVLEGVRPGDGRGRARGARARAAQAALHDRHRRRRVGDEPAVRAPASTSSRLETVRAVFFGLGSDGTVGANKNTIKILGDAGLHAQGYFVYDSKKSGSQTISHLRFGPEPIRAPYLVSGASFVGCHQFGLLERPEVLDRAAPGATLLLNTHHPPDRVWDKLARRVQRRMLEKDVRLYVIDAGRIARAAGLAGRTNTVLQTCFFAISGVLEREQAIERIKASIEKTYGAPRRGGGRAQPARRRQRADGPAPRRAARRGHLRPRRAARSSPATRPSSCATVSAAMMAGRGDELPVSALPVDGTYPSGTTKYEKRNISDLVAVWDSELCIQCGNCSFVCPHSVIRSRYYDASRLEGAPAQFRSAPLNAPGPPEHPLHAAGLRRGLHRLRAVRRGVPGLGGRRPGAQGDQPRRARAAGRAGAREHRVLRGPARGRPLARGLRHRARHPVPRAAVRVLGRLRGLRRDAVPQAPLAALRRPHDRRQRDRLLVDLRRQPARPRRGRPAPTGAARRGRTRCSRTTPSSGSVCGSPPTATPSWRAGACPSCASRWAPSSSTRSSTAPQLRESELREQRERVAELERRLDGLDGPAADRPAQRARPPDPPQRVDRRRRRLGLRHRLRRARPRAGERQQRQRARARHRGLLQHRRADVEGDAARRRREVRRRRQDDAHQGPRAAGDRARQRLRRARRDGRRPAADADARSARPRPTTGRRWSSPTATASRTATTCATGSTSSTARWRAATGR